MRARLLFVVAAALLFAASPAAAKTYSAEQYDVRMEIQDDGSVRVTETIVLRFEDGPFERFFREIPARRTDGLEFESASLDGRVLPWGDGAGQAEISGRNTRRVTWRFAPVEYARHEFTLVYRVRGLIRQSDTADRILWRALPSEHDYAIASSVITVVTRAPLAADPDVRTRRAGATTAIPDARGLVVAAQEIRRNGYVELRLDYPRGALVQAPPLWQQAQLSANASAPYWLIGAASLAVLALIPVIALRAHYTAPPDDVSRATEGVTRPPDDLPPSLAGVLLSSGKASGSHTLGTLFALADRGAVTISEVAKKSFGQRKFEIRRNPEALQLSTLERLVLDAAFRHKGRTESKARLDEATKRLRGNLKPFQQAARDEIRRRGFWDDDRAHNRRRMFGLATVWLLAAGLWVPIGLLALNAYLAWPLVLSAGLAVAGIVTLVAAASRTPLSNDGVRRAARWRAYAKHLKQVARGKAAAEGGPASGLLPTAVALGLAGEWGRFLKKQPGQLPDWFECASEDGGAAIAALVASSAAHSGAGGASGAGAAAGGGASGAS